jgi:hypothetical protein
MRENMDDNIWEYPFGDLDDDEEIFFRKPGLNKEGSPAYIFKNGLQDSLKCFC